MQQENRQIHITQQENKHMHIMQQETTVTALKNNPGSSTRVLTILSHKQYQRTYKSRERSPTVKKAELCSETNYL